MALSLRTLGQLAGVAGDVVAGANTDRRQRLADALAAKKAADDAERARVTNALTGAQTRKTIAEAADLEDTGGYAGHTVDQDGNTWIITKRGLLRPATADDAEHLPSGTAAPSVAPAAKAIAPTLEAPTDMTSALQGVRTAPAVVPASPVARPALTSPSPTPPTTPEPVQGPTGPKFGPKAKYQRVQVTHNGKPAFALQDESGNLLDVVTHQPLTGTVEPFVAPSFSFPTGVDEHGKPIIFRGNSKTGALESTGQGAKTSQGVGSAPMAAKVGQFGEMLKKYQDLASATENLDVTLGQSAASDIAQHGIGIRGFAHIPGTKGLGNALMDRSPQYAQYQAALTPWILAAAHALSGARINQDQVDQIRQSVELRPGDFGNPTVRAQKEKNLIDLINSIGGSLPEDAITEQENQLDPSAMQSIVAKGYRRRKGGTTGGGRTVTVNGKKFTVPE